MVHPKQEVLLQELQSPLSFNRVSVWVNNNNNNEESFDDETKRLAYIIS